MNEDVDRVASAIIRATNRRANFYAADEETKDECPVALVAA